MTAGARSCATASRTTWATSRCTFTVRFPDGADGDRARERLPRAIAQSHDRLCTVVAHACSAAAPVHMRED